MKLHRLPFFIALLSLMVFSCADSKNLESIKISPTVQKATDDAEHDSYACESNVDQYRQFEAIGIYSDDSEEDFTDDVEWSSDASTDSYLSSSVPGLVWCRTAYGVIAIVATYTLNTGDSVTTGEEASTELKDTVFVDAD